MNHKMRVAAHMIKEFVSYLHTTHARWFWGAQALNFLMMFFILIENQNALTATAKGLFSILYIVFLPGYCLSKMLFRDDEIEFHERLLYSVGISVFVVASLALILFFSPLGINRYFIITSIVILTFISIIGKYRIDKHNRALSCMRNRSIDIE